MHIKRSLMPSDLEYMEQGLNAYNQTQTGMTRCAESYMAYTDDGPVCGGIKISNVDLHFFISWLFVDEKYRGQGIGTALMRYAEEQAVLGKCTEIFVDTMSFQATAFYQKMGYAECARITHFYPGYDRVFYRKKVV